MPSLLLLLRQIGVKHEAVFLAASAGEAQRTCRERPSSRLTCCWQV